MQPCDVEGVEGKKLCGTYEVFENRASKQGRKIKLKIVVFVATGPNPQPDPFIYIPGGPGSSATEDAPYLAKPFAKIREQRDLLFIDQRGTGGSNPLNCDFYNPSEPQSYLEYSFPLKMCAVVANSSKVRRTSVSTPLRLRWTTLMKCERPLVTGN